MGDEILTLEIAERVLQLHELDEEIVLGIELGRAVGKGTAFFRAFAQADGAHLGEGADGFGDAPADGLNARDKCRGYGPQTGQQDTQFPSGGLDGNRTGQCQFSYKISQGMNV